MKSKKAFPFVNLLRAAAAGLIILVPVRVYQYFKLIEPDTGFYSKQNFSVYIIYAVMLFLAVFSFAAAFSGRKRVETKTVKDAPMLNACAFLLGGIGFVSDAVASLIDFFDIYSSYSYNPTLTMSQYLSQEGGSLLMLEAILGLIAAVYFALLAGAAFSGRDIAPKFKLIALSGSLWTVMKLLTMFKTKISFINVSDLFISLFGYAFLMLFLFYLAVSLSQVDKGQNYYKLFAYGVPAAVLLLTCFLPRLVLVIVGKSELICAGYGLELCDFAFGGMTALILIARTYAQPSKGENKDQ